MSDPGRNQVDDLRAQLRALGYLDAGVDRFVLGSATTARRPAAIALFGGLRVGCLAALLLGPAAAIGLTNRLPGLVTGARDAVVVALYLGLLFGTVVSIVAVAASLLVSSLATEGVARHARRLSRAAGTIVAVGCLAYLTLWWRTANTGFGWAAPAWTGFALAVAVAVSLLLGHAVRVTAFAVILARRHSAGVDAEPPAQIALAPRWRMTIVAAVAAFAGAAALLVATAPGEAPGSATHVPLAVVSSGLRVRLIAIDGIDPAVLDDLARAGRIPRLAAVLTATRARLKSDETAEVHDPARAWTTIATGRTPADHGVRGIEMTRVAGLQGAVTAGTRSALGRTIRTATDLVRLTRPSIASGDQRRVKTIWDVASDAGMRTAVVNWWATWPASSAGANAIVLSDRATLRFERGGAPDAEVAPASIYETLRAAYSTIRGEAAARAAAAASGLDWHDGDVRAVLNRSAELDAIQLGLLRAVSMPAPDLAAVYLPGLDIAQTTLLGGGETALAPSLVAARLQALRDYYVFLDRALADQLSPGEHDLVVVVTLPGRVSASTDGLLAVVGRPASGAVDAPARTADVAPTVLHLLGLPLSRELAGSPVTPLFTQEFARRYPVRQVDGYGPPSTRAAARSGQPLDQEMIDRLRSLGYVK